jgi:hypothetical protein
MINESKPTSSMTNISRVSFGETWDNNLQTWNEDTTTWNASGSLMTNELISTNFFFSIRRTPFLETAPFTVGGGMTNQSKP